MKILITTDWFVPVVNGVVTSVKNLYRELKLKGHDVRILTLQQEEFVEMEDTYYIKSFSANSIYPNARILRSFASSTINEIIEWSPEVIHSQCEFNTYFFAKKISKKLNIPIVHTYHTMYEDYAHYLLGNKKINRAIIRKLSKYVVDRTDAIVVPTGKVKDALSDYRVSKPINVVPTGVKLTTQNCLSKKEETYLRTLHNIPEDHFIMLYLGRLGKEKNVDELISFFKKSCLDKVSLLIVGDGPMRRVLQDMVTSNDSIIFTGKVSPEEVYKYYMMSDVFVSASTSETQGLTYFEALACGLPALCKEDKCLDDVIINCFNGYQYKNFESFKNYLNTMIRKPEERRFMSKNARDYSKRFSTEAFANAIEAVYIKAINELDIRVS